jgi:porin
MRNIRRWASPAVVAWLTIAAAATAQSEQPANPETPANPEAPVNPETPATPETPTAENTPPSPGGWLQQDRMTGDWGTVRDQLAERGLSFDLYYNHFYGINAHGGADTKNAQRNSGSLDIFLRFDFEKLGMIPGGEVLVHAKQRYGINVNEKVGALSDPFDDADGDEEILISQLWYQQRLLDRKLRIRLGFLDFGTILDANAYAASEDKQFMATYLDNNSAIIPFNVGLGAAVFYDPTDWLGFIVGASDRDAKLTKPGFDTTFHDGADFYGYFESQLRAKLNTDRGPLPGHYRFGLAYDPRPRPVFGSGRPDRGIPAELDGDDVGFYVSFDQLVFREGPDDEQGLGLFARYGFRHGGTNRLEHFWSVGGQYEGLLPHRDKDVLGLGMYSVHASRDYREAVNPEFHRETGFELYYQIQASPWLAFAPDLQYIIDPGGTDNTNDALVVGFRARITF